VGKKKKYIPGIFTILNLLFGFFALVRIGSGHHLSGFLLIFLGAIFDGLDGKLARILNRETNFGREFDSLADIITFCAAPAFMMYQIYLSRLGLPGILIAFVFLLSGSIRLARYNIIQDKEEDFKGLPVPAAALTFGSFVWFNFTIFGDYGISELALALIFILSFFMVSSIDFSPFPVISFNKNWFITLRSLFVISLMILFVIFRGYVLFPVMGIYIVNNVFKWMVKQANGELVDHKER